MNGLKKQKERPKGKIENNMQERRTTTQKKQNNLLKELHTKPYRKKEGKKIKRGLKRNIKK